jgi:GTPase SAR1 family protein
VEAEGEGNSLVRIGVVGIGGAGKTLLLKRVFNSQKEEKLKAEEPSGEGGSRETEGKRGAGDYEDISPRLEDLIMAGEFGSPKTPILLLYLLFSSVQILLLLGKVSILTSNIYPFNCAKRSIVFTLVWGRLLFVNNCRKSSLSHKFD